MQRCLFSCHQRENYKLLSEKSSKQFLQNVFTENIQTILKNYYHRNHSKQFLQTITIEVIPNYVFKLFQTILSIIREIIPNNSYKLLTQKSFQTILTNYYKRKSVQKMPIHYDQYYRLCLKTMNGKLIFILQQQYYQTNNCKQYLQVLFREFNALQRNLILGLLVCLLQTMKLLKNSVKKFCTNKA